MRVLSAVGYENRGIHSQLRLCHLLSQLWVTCPSCGPVELPGQPALRGPSGQVSSLGLPPCHFLSFYAEPHDPQASGMWKGKRLLCSIREGLVIIFLKVSLLPLDHLSDQITLGILLAPAGTSGGILISTLQSTVTVSSRLRLVANPLEGDCHSCLADGEPKGDRVTQGTTARK